MKSHRYGPSKRVQVIAELLTAILLTFMLACGGGSQSSSAGPTLTSLQITPATQSVAAGNTQQFTATGTFSDNSTQDLSSTATWSSSSTAVATINSSGLATTITTGMTTITATSGSVNGSTALNVNSPAAGVTDSAGMATLISNGLTVPIQLTDQDTGAALTNVAVALGNDPTVPGSAIILVADSTGAHPLQIILLQSPQTTGNVAKTTRVPVRKLAPHVSSSPVAIPVSGGCPLKSGTTASAAITDLNIPPPPSPAPLAPAGLGQQLLDALNAMLGLTANVLPSGFQGPVSVQQDTATPDQTCLEQLISITEEEAPFAAGKIFLLRAIPALETSAVLVPAGIVGFILTAPETFNTFNTCYYGGKSVNVEKICWGSWCVNVPLGPAQVPTTYPVAVTVEPPGPSSLTFINPGNLGLDVVGTTDGTGTGTVEVPAGADTVCVDSPGSQQFTQPGFIVSAPGGPLNVTLTPQAQAQLTISPTSLAFSATQGGSNPSSQGLTIGSTSGTLNWTASSNAGWLTVSSGSGATPATVSISANASGLSAGTYTGAISVAATG